MAGKIKVQTLCPLCGKPIPTVRVKEVRLSRTLEYPVLDEAAYVVVMGRAVHNECLATHGTSAAIAQ